jgi:ribosomal protein S18 acetylase RimI-like enzyme
VRLNGWPRATFCARADPSDDFGHGDGGAIHRRLDEDDAGALAAFRCRKLGEPWADDVEYAVRNELADSLRGGFITAEGEWQDDDLAGLIAWRPERDPAIRSRFGDEVWRVTLLAVSVDYRDRLYARQLKRWLLGEAHASGIRFVTSNVHWDNGRMIEMNKRFGGSVERTMKGPYRFDEEFCVCVVPAGVWPSDVTPRFPHTTA